MLRPKAPTAVQIPIAFARSLRGNVFVMIESVAGSTNAAPRPCTARNVISCPALPDMAAPAEPAPKITSPTVIHRFRPNRSPRLPPSSSSPARINTYPSTTHCSVDVAAPRSTEIAGSAVFTTVLSMNTIRVPMDMTARIHHRRARTESGGADMSLEVLTFAFSFSSDGNSTARRNVALDISTTLDKGLFPSFEKGSKIDEPGERKNETPAGQHC